MKRLLFVTQDKRYWDQVSMRRNDPRFFLMPADDIRSARLFLESTRVDLIFVDIAGSNLDGFSLIGSVLTAHTRSTPLVAVCKEHRGEPRLTTGMGVMVVSRDDLSLRDCQSTLKSYDGLLKRHEPHGNGIHDIVELAGVEGRSLSIGVRAGRKDGWIFIQQGIVAEASNGAACDATLVDELDDWPAIQLKVAPFSNTALNAARETLALPQVIEDTGIFQAVTQDRSKEEASGPAESEPEIAAVPPSAPAAVATEPPSPFPEPDPSIELAAAPTPAQDPPPDLGPFGPLPTQVALDVSGANEIIASFEAEVPTFSAALLVDDEGRLLTLTGYLSESDRNRITNAVHLLFSGGRRILANLSVDDFQCLTLEAENGVITCWPAREGLLAVIAGDPRSLGKIRIVVKRILPDLVQFLEAMAAAR